MDKALAHLPIPVAWQTVTGRRRILPCKRRQNTVVVGDEEDGGYGRFQRLGLSAFASRRRGEGPRGVASAWEWPELRGRSRGIAGELGSGTAARGLPGRAAASSGYGREMW